MNKRLTISRNVMVTLGLTPDSPLNYANAENVKPVIIVEVDDDAKTIAKRISWLDDEFCNLIIGLDDKFLVTPTPVSSVLFNQFVSEQPEGSPLDFLDWIQERLKLAPIAVAYIRPKPLPSA